MNEIKKEMYIRFPYSFFSKDGCHDIMNKLNGMGWRVVKTYPNEEETFFGIVTEDEREHINIPYSFFDEDGSEEIVDKLIDMGYDIIKDIAWWNGNG